MKWPESLTLVRHGESSYNALKAAKESNPLYQKFLRSYKANWRSARTRELAGLVTRELALDFGDHNTPLTEIGQRQSLETGKKLKELIPMPQVIFVSPYERTHHTLNWITKGWPELSEVKTYEEERIREMEHGLRLLYNDSKVFYALHPEQRLLQEQEGDYWYRHPQGENVPDIRERNRSWISTLIREFSGKHVLAVTHHITILATRSNLERLSAAQYLELDRSDRPYNCGVSHYQAVEGGQDGKFNLSFYNARLYNF